MNHTKYKSPVGWRYESYRHYLAAKGVKTNYRYFQKGEVGDISKAFGYKTRTERAKESVKKVEEAARKVGGVAKRGFEFVRERVTPAGRAVRAAREMSEEELRDADRMQQEQEMEDEHIRQRAKEMGIGVQPEKPRGVAEALREPRTFEIGGGRAVTTQLAELTARPQVSKVAAEQIIEERPFERAMAQFRSGDYAAGLQVLTSGTATPDQVSALRQAIQEQAVSRVSTGLPLPDFMQQKGVLTAETEARIKLIKERQAREFESPTKTFAREFGKDILVGAVSLPEQALGIEKAGFAGVTAGLGEQPKEYVGLAGEMEGLKYNPFFATNVFVGNEEDGYLRPGWINQMPEKTERVTERKLKQAFAWGKEEGVPDMTGTILDTPSSILSKPAGELMGAFGGGENLVLGGGAKKIPSYADQVRQKVNSLYNRRQQIAKADFAPYRKGEDAFRKGDREGVVNAIISLEAQEGEFRDRWNFIEQAHRQLLSGQNYEETYAGRQGLRDMLDGGSQRLADETRKLNEVKAAVKSANYSIASRRDVLKRKLQQLDAGAVPSPVAKKKSLGEKVAPEELLRGGTEWLR